MDRTTMRPRSQSPAQGMPPAALLWALAMATVLAAGCTVIRIEEGTGVRTQLLPGVAKVVIADPAIAGVAAVNTSGVGLVWGPRSVAVGWMSERVVAVPPDGACKLVLIDSDPDELRANLALLQAAGADARSICSVMTKGSRK